MKNNGLCSTCVLADTCIYVKQTAVLFCEEFSNGTYAPVSIKKTKAGRAISCEVATESE